MTVLLTKTYTLGPYEITEHHEPLPLVSWYELSESQRATFDYMDVEDRCTDRLFHYRDSWYDVNEFDRVLTSGDLARAGWDGILPESVWSGIVVRYTAEYLTDTVDYSHVLPAFVYTP